MHQSPSSSDRNFFNVVGWLFADLLLVLAVVFLVASTVGSPPLSPQRTPTPQGMLPICTPAPTATPTQPPAPGLDTNPVSITLNVNVYALLNGDLNELRAIDHQVRTQTSSIGERKVGVALTFAGGPDAGEDTMIAKAVDQELVRMGSQEHYLFDQAVFRPLIDLNKNAGIVQVDMFLFKASPAAGTPTPILPTGCQVGTPTS